MKSIKEQFNDRAMDYNSYTKWLEDPELFRLCTLPLIDYVNNAKCLDIGGGTGWIAYHDHIKSGREWTVVDISEGMGSMIPECIKFICANAEQIPLPDKSFDFIIIRSVLEYTDIPKVLGEVRRLLKEEGYFVLSQKVMDGYNSDINLILKLEQLRNPLKKNLGFMSNLVNTVNKCGLNVINSRSYTQRYSIDYNKWLSRSNTISKKSQDALKNIVENLSDEVIQRTGLRLVDSTLYSNLTWAIITCHKNSYINPKIDIVVSMIVEKIDGESKKILLQKRKYLFTEPHYYNVWELPQGKIEPNEMILDTAARELLEETNLELVCSLLFEKTTTLRDVKLQRLDIMTTVFSRGSINYLGLCLLVQANGVPMPKIQNTEPEWIDVSKLQTMLDKEAFFPLNIPMIEKYLEMQNEKNLFRR